MGRRISMDVVSFFGDLRLIRFFLVAALFFSLHESNSVSPRCEAVAQVRGALNAGEAADDVHPERGKGVDRFKRGRFQSVGQHVAGEAVEAKVGLALLFALHRDDGAHAALIEIGVHVMALFQSRGGHESNVAVDEVTLGDAEHVWRVVVAAGGDADALGPDRVRNGAFRVLVDLVASQRASLVRDECVAVKAGRSAVVVDNLLGRVAGSRVCGILATASFHFQAKEDESAAAASGAFVA